MAAARHRVRFVTLDVFTDRCFTGNPLAVLTDARHADGRPLDAETMQAIAAEFGFSETAFVQPSRRADCLRRVRIFTPATELPFAGHPTVGSAIALALEGTLVMVGDRAEAAFDLGAGPTRVGVRRVDGRLWAELTAPECPSQGPMTDPAAVAAALQVPVQAVDGTAHPPTDASAGLPFLVVRLADLDALAAAAPDRASLATLSSPGARHGAVCYVPTADELRVRVFVPEMGIAEDPATGSAAAALAGLLGGLGEVTDGTHSFRIVQGVEMGRASRIEAAVDVRGGRVVAVRVAGTAVVVTDGWLHLPPAN